jgi:hypothetical protein
MSPYDMLEKENAGDGSKMGVALQIWMKGCGPPLRVAMTRPKGKGVSDKR